jgi:hypothetical protein
VFPNAFIVCFWVVVFNQFMVECTYIYIYIYIWYSPVLKPNILDIAGFGGRFDRWMMDA